MNKLKKLLICTFLLTVVSSLCAFSQTDDQNNSRLGIKGGLNISSLTDENGNDQSGLLGFNGGVFLKIAVTRHFAFQPELLYSMKGAEINYDNTFVDGNARFSLNYIDVPILGVFSITENINIHGGFYVASLASVSIKNESSNSLFNFEDELDKDDFEALDYGLVVGLGGDLDKISFGIRYEHGLKTVGKERTFLGESYRFPDAQNATFQIYFGISIL